MTPTYSAWSTAPWGRYDTEPPALPTRTITTPDGQTWEVSEPVDPAWHREHWHEGAEVHDHDRGVTYRATVDPRTGRLDHLEVVIDGGGIDDNALRRVPVERVARAVRVQVNADARARAEDGPETFTVGLPGSLRREGDKPALEELADRMTRLGEGRQELAAHYGRNLRTVDNWIREARQSIPEQMPAARRGRRPQTSGGKPSPDNLKRRNTK